MTDDGTAELGLAYADALNELDEILAQLESSTIDVDVLAERVARGVELVGHCRRRLRQVRADVNLVIDELLDDTADDERSRRG